MVRLLTHIFLIPLFSTVLLTGCIEKLSGSLGGSSSGEPSPPITSPPPPPNPFEMSQSKVFEGTFGAPSKGNILSTFSGKYLFYDQPTVVNGYSKVGVINSSTGDITTIDFGSIVGGNDFNVVQSPYAEHSIIKLNNKLYFYNHTTGVNTLFDDDASDMWLNEIAFSPDGQYFAYPSNSGQISNQLRIVRLSDFNISLGNDTLGPAGAQWILLSSLQTATKLHSLHRIFFNFDLYTVDLDGSNQLKVSGTLPGGTAAIDKFDFTDDGNWLIYIGDQDTLYRDEAFTVRPDGTGRTKLHSNFTASPQAAYGYTIAPDSSYYIIEVRLGSGSGNEIFAVDVDGSNPRK
ncbi:MAG: hypothetical protein R2827_04155 [Bdellovibrionales bacterium]